MLDSIFFHPLIILCLRLHLCMVSFINVIKLYFDLLHTAQHSAFIFVLVVWIHKKNCSRRFEMSFFSIILAIVYELGALNLHLHHVTLSYVNFDYLFLIFSNVSSSNPNSHFILNIVLAKSYRFDFSLLIISNQIRFVHILLIN